MFLRERPSRGCLRVELLSLQAPSISSGRLGCHFRTVTQIDDRIPRVSLEEWVGCPRRDVLRTCQHISNWGIYSPPPDGPRTIPYSLPGCTVPVGSAPAQIASGPR